MEETLKPSRELFIQSNLHKSNIVAIRTKGRISKGYRSIGQQNRIMYRHVLGRQGDIARPSFKIGIKVPRELLGLI